MGGLFFSQPPFPFQVWPDLSETKIFLGAFASTYPLMLLSSPSEFLLACSFSSPWNLLFFTVESIFSSLCSRSDRPLFRQTALFLFILAKAALAYLPTAFSLALRQLSFSAGPACSTLSVEACAILQALCWSRQHQQVCHFFSLLLLSDSRSVIVTLFSPPSFLLPQSLWQI